MFREFAWKAKNPLIDPHSEKYCSVNCNCHLRCKDQPIGLRFTVMVIRNSWNGCLLSCSFVPSGNKLLKLMPPPVDDRSCEPKSEAAVTENNKVQNEQFISITTSQRPHKSRGTEKEDKQRGVPPSSRFFISAIAEPGVGTLFLLISLCFRKWSSKMAGNQTWSNDVLEQISNWAEIAQL
jgi:hypothetical protein